MSDSDTPAENYNDEYGDVKPGKWVPSKRGLAGLGVATLLAAGGVGVGLYFLIGVVSIIYYFYQNFVR